MTRKQLEQYPYLKAKMKRLRREIEDLRGDWAVCGAVMASQHMPPYELREVVVGARVPDKRAQSRLYEKRQELELAISEKHAIEQFIASVADMRIKEFLTLKYIYGETWAEVAAHFGYTETEGSVKMAVKRFFS